MERIPLNIRLVIDDVMETCADWRTNCADARMKRTNNRGLGDCIRCEEVPVCMAAWFSPGKKNKGKRLFKKNIIVLAWYI